MTRSESESESESGAGATSLAEADGGLAGKKVVFAYRNYRGELSIREAIAQRFWIGSTQYHFDLQVFLTAYDLERQELRDFAMRDVYCMQLSR